jgi:hypothetical protein
VEEGTPFMRWAKVLFGMVLLLLAEYLAVVLLLGAAQALVIPHPRTFSIVEGGDTLLALGLTV